MLMVYMFMHAKSHCFYGIWKNLVLVISSSASKRMQGADSDFLNYNFTQMKTL